MYKSTDEIKTSVRDFIASTSFSDITMLKDDTLIFRDGFFDSMGLMSLITFLEETQKIIIMDNDLIEENFETINAIVKFVISKDMLS